MQLKEFEEFYFVKVKYLMAILLYLECQESSVPTILVRLVSMILEGRKPNRELNESQRRIACNIAQIIQFNAVKQTRKETTVKFRHSREIEPPLPLVIGLKIHSKMMKKALIADLSISYDRAMDIHSSLITHH